MSTHRRCPVPLESLDASARDFSAAVGLPPAVYADPDFFAFEKEAVFGHEWICVGRADQIPERGDFYTITVAGEPMIVVREAQDRINVMSSVCQHRGMCVTAPAQRPQEEWLELPPETSGNCRTFRCPYHWWTYDLDGKLVGAPEMGSTTDFARSEIGLPRLRTELWQGFIFVNFDDEAPSLAPRLGKLDEVLVNYHVADMLTVDPATIGGLPFNWKIMVENFMEGYHPDRLHKGIHDFAPSSKAWYAPFEEGEAAMYGHMGATIPDGGFNATQKAIFPIIPTLTTEERWRMLFAYVPPSLLMGFQPDSAFWFTVQPVSESSHTLTMAYIFPPSTLEVPLFDELLGAAIHGVELFNNQDLPTNTAVQRGMESRFAPRGRYSWQESVLAQFNTWLASCYRAEDARATAAMVGV